STRGRRCSVDGVEGPPQGGHYSLGGVPDPVTVFATASAFSFTFCSHRRAHANSSPRIPRPAGITMNAGPGSTIIAIPIARTVKPTTETAMRRARRYAMLGMMGGGSISEGFRHDGTRQRQYNLGSGETARTCRAARVSVGR